MAHAYCVAGGITQKIKCRWSQSMASGNRRKNEKGTRSRAELGDRKLLEPTDERCASREAEAVKFSAEPSWRNLFGRKKGAKPKPVALCPLDIQHAHDCATDLLRCAAEGARDWCQ